MRWKVKALLQNTVSWLPSGSSYAAYYWLQRHFGGLRELNPVAHLAAGLDTWQQIVKCGDAPAGKTFLEVGTGRVPMTPVAFWLLGADRCITIDLNPYLKAELVAESLAYIDDHAGEIETLFGPLLNLDRFAALRRLRDHDGRSIGDRLLQLCRIHYIAPGDATGTGLDPGSVHFHTSYNVFEHIPPDVLAAILSEGNRILAPGGLFVHRIDYSDHFSHSDRRITAVNFLQYSDARWERYAGNRYMYMNRLRHDDFLDLFRAAGHRVLETDPAIDAASLALLDRGGLPLDRRFAKKSCKLLATIDSWIVSRPAH